MSAFWTWPSFWVLVLNAGTVAVSVWNWWDSRKWRKRMGLRK